MPRCGIEGPQHGKQQSAGQLPSHCPSIAGPGSFQVRIAQRLYVFQISSRAPVRNRAVHRLVLLKTALAFNPRVPIPQLPKFPKIAVNHCSCSD
jgi:hypothetical protein